MPGYLLHQGAMVMCTHLGPAQPSAPNPRVKVSGQPVVVQSCQYMVTGCLFPTTSPGSPPCASAMWTTAATRVRVGGAPVLLQDSMATCTPNGTPLNILVTQMRVKGT